LIGSIVGHYRILDRLGAGGMGVVYRAEDVRLGRQVALKFLPQELADNREALERFQREARVASSLNHPYICTIHDVGEHEGQHFIVMELLDGHALKEDIARGPLPFDRVLDLGVEIADALDAAHANGIVHRDIKPANIFINRRGQAKVLDFGLAKLAAKAASQFSDADVTRVTEGVTTLGTTLGTVAYMSPEQARGHDIDGRSDLFSFGIVLYEMATGTLPFSGKTPIAIFEELLTRNPPPPSTVNTAVPSEFDRIVAKALEKDRAVRYQNAADLRTDLKRLKRASEPQSVPGMGTAAMPPAPPKRQARWLWIGGAAAAMAALAAGAFVYSNANRTGAFAERDSVVLADFANSTGEPVFDDTLKEALEVQLRQSPFLSVLPEQRVQGTLKLMGRTPADKITPEIARDICERTASKAMIAGAISQLGTSYVISLNASNCRSGDTLEKSQVQASGKDDVLKALGSAVEQLRRGLGESLASIEKYDAPIQGATTASLDALKSYSLGMSTRRRQGDAASLPFFKKAVEQDPEFALAHARLGTVYANLGEGVLSRTHTTKAYELKDRVSEPERLYITARYFTTVEVSTQKAIDAYQVWTQTYPKDFVPHSNVAGLYENRGEHDQAVEEYRTAISLAPDEPLPYSNLAGVYNSMGKPDESRKTIESGIARGVDSSGFRAGLYILAFFRNDEAEMARQVEVGRKLPDAVRLVAAQTGTALYAGRLGRARDLARQYADESISKTGLKGAAAQIWTNVGQSAGAFGDTALARTAARTALDLERNLGTLLQSAFCLAFAGDLDEAQKLTAEASKLPGASNEDVQREVAFVNALSRLKKGDLTAFGAMPVPKDDNEIGLIYMIGVAHFDQGHTEMAAKEFKRLVDRRAQTINPLKPLAHLYYGRTLARMGKSAEGRNAYDEFFAIWKDADANLPVVRAARAEYTHLKANDQ
jgi:eukaryotic-like serine/threonine-protein kinase